MTISVIINHEGKDFGLCIEVVDLEEFFSRERPFDTVFEHFSQGAQELYDAQRREESPWGV